MDSRDHYSINDMPICGTKVRPIITTTHIPDVTCPTCLLIIKVGDKKLDRG